MPKLKTLYNTSELVVPKGLEKCKFVGHDMGDTILAEFLTRRQRNLLPSELSNIVGEVIFTNGGMVFNQINARLVQTFMSYEITGPIMRTLQNSDFFKSQIQPRLFKKTIRKIFSNRFQKENPAAIEEYRHCVHSCRKSRGYPDDES